MQTHRLFGTDRDLLAGVITSMSFFLRLGRNMRSCNGVLRVYIYSEMRSTLATPRFEGVALPAFAFVGAAAPAAFISIYNKRNPNKNTDFAATNASQVGPFFRTDPGACDVPANENHRLAKQLAFSLGL